MEITELKELKTTKFSVLGYKITDEEYNLAREFKRVIELAYNRYPTAKTEDIAEMLGLCTRSLYRICHEWNIERPKKTQQVRKRKEELLKMGIVN